MAAVVTTFAVAALFLGVWAVAHRAGAPGREVSVLWGLVEYTKTPDRDSASDIAALRREWEERFRIVEEEAKARESVRELEEQIQRVQGEVGGDTQGAERIIQLEDERDRLKAEVAALRARREVPAFGIQGTFFSELDSRVLTGQSLEGLSMERDDLRGLGLAGKLLRGSSFARADLQAANLARADLREVNFERSNLRDAELSAADLTGANMRWSTLGGANLERATLDNTDLQHADLRQVEGLSCEQLTRARNWESAFRDKGLASGQELPTR